MSQDEIRARGELYGPEPAEGKTEQLAPALEQTPTERIVELLNVLLVIFVVLGAVLAASVILWGTAAVWREILNG